MTRRRVDVTTHAVSRLSGAREDPRARARVSARRLGAASARGRDRARVGTRVARSLSVERYMTRRIASAVDYTKTTSDPLAPNLRSVDGWEG